VKKEVKNGRNLWKIWGCVAGEGEFENGGQKPLGHLERAQKILEKVFQKSIGKRVCCEAYVVSRCQRGDWYIGLYNNDKILQHVLSTPPSGG